MNPAIEDFLDQLRTSLYRYREQFERGEITSIAITGRNERKQRCDRWYVSVQPLTDEKVMEAWGLTRVHA